MSAPRPRLPKPQLVLATPPSAIPGTTPAYARGIFLGAIRVRRDLADECRRDACDAGLAGDLGEACRLRDQINRRTGVFKMTHMTVKALSMRTEEYGADRGKLKGSVTFTGGLGEVSIAIDNDKASKILAILADELVATAQGVAKLLVGQIVEQAAANSTLAIEGTVQ